MKYRPGSPIGMPGRFHCRGSGLQERNIDIFNAGNGPTVAITGVWADNTFQAGADDANGGWKVALASLLDDL